MRSKPPAIGLQKPQREQAKKTAASRRGAGARNLAIRSLVYGPVPRHPGPRRPFHGRSGQALQRNARSGADPAHRAARGDGRERLSEFPLRAAASGHKFFHLTCVLYQQECNIRSATVLGFVGAGGIRQQISISMNLFNYAKVATLAGTTIVVVLLVDHFSAAVRRRLAY